MTGDSGTPLHKKLGIEEDMTVGISGAPDGFEVLLGVLPNGVEFHDGLMPSNMFIVFSRLSSEMESGFHSAMASIPADGAIWVAWPKKASGVETDLTGDTMRELFLPTGMIDNQVCAIDETWSGLRFVVRKENRAEWKAASPNSRKPA